MIEVLDGPSTWQRIEQAASTAVVAQVGVAYITSKQLEKLLPSLKKVAGRKGGAVSIVCGIGDICAQSPDALRELDEFAQRNPKKVVFGVVAPNSGLFHPKYYYFEGDNQADIFIGSSNLTPPAFHNNTECNLHLSLSANDPLARDCRRTFEMWVRQAKEPSAVVQDYVQFGEVHEKASELQAEIERLTVKLGQTIREAPPLPLRALPTPSPRSRVTDLVATGYIGDVEVLTTQFHITIDSRLTGKVGAVTKTVGNLVVVDQRSIRWSLLDKDDSERLRKLRNSITFSQREYVIQTAWGQYIPESMFGLWMSWVQERNSAFQDFHNHVIEHLRGRQTEKMDEFRHDFYKLYPRASNTAADTIAQQVKSKFQVLIGSRNLHQSTLRPRWWSARTLVYPSPLPKVLEAGLQEFARTVSDEVNAHDLARFALALCKHTRNYAATAFKAGSQKKTITEALLQLERLNFYGDIPLNEWASKVATVAEIIPQAGDWMSPREFDLHKAEAKEQLETLIQNAVELEDAVVSWQTLSPERVLKEFLKILSVEESS